MYLKSMSIKICSNIKSEAGNVVGFEDKEGGKNQIRKGLVLGWILSIGNIPKGFLSNCITS